jgi:hypothetical protein
VFTPTKSVWFSTGNWPLQTTTRRICTSLSTRQFVKDMVICARITNILPVIARMHLGWYPNWGPSLPRAVFKSRPMQAATRVWGCRLFDMSGAAGSAIGGDSERRQTLIGRRIRLPHPPRQDGRLTSGPWPNQRRATPWRRHIVTNAMNKSVLQPPTLGPMNGRWLC